ncbi:unnamed protein product [Mesocestoides corti]|uniref:Uncharacterized protein n=1 Tax=Mesocestoides corti TaxID=53468 RepID=A0A3P6GEW2_MESCO|nr:unnamed protein product [Mesocestoides corti]
MSTLWAKTQTGSGRTRCSQASWTRPPSYTWPTPTRSSTRRDTPTEWTDGGAPQLQTALFCSFSHSHQSRF